MQRTQLLSASLLIACLCANPGRAQQEPEWTNVASAQGKLGIDVAITAEQEAYIAGQYQGQIMLRKIAADGTELWEVTSLVNQDLRREVPTNVFVDPDGNVVVVGYRYYLWNEWGREILMLAVLKYAPDGSLIYKHLWPGHFSSFNNQRYRNGVFARMDAEGSLYIGTGGNVDGFPTGSNVIKVSPTGNIIWVRTEPMAEDFFMAYGLRLLGDKLGLVGASSYLDGNSTAWVLDTTGTTLWTDVRDGEGARDIVLAEDGGAYVLTWRDPGFVGDVVVYKINADGTTAWDNTYDQGRHESALAMEPSPDGALLILAKGNTPANVYTDWLTLKVDAAGDLLWAQRYNEHANNYETPYRIAVDAAGNTFVTGDGGPPPSVTDLSRVQLVTVQYSPTGDLLWTALRDTLTTTNHGADLATDPQGGVFVLGLEFAILFHYGADMTTGVANVNAADAPSIYPNPTSGDLHVVLNESTGANAYIQLLDMDGRVVFQQRATSGTMHIDVRDLTAGVYVCEVRNGEQRARTRVVVR